MGAKQNLACDESLIAIHHTAKMLQVVLFLLFALLISETVLSEFDRIEASLIVSIIIIFALYLWIDVDTTSTIVGIALWTLTLQATYLAWFYQGLFGVAIMAYPCIILLSLILGTRALSVSLLLSILLLVVLLIFAHSFGFMPDNSAMLDDYSVRGIKVSLLLACFSVIAYIFVRDVRKEHQKVQFHNKSLTVQLKQSSELVNYDQMTQLPNERICEGEIRDKLESIIASGNKLSFMSIEPQNLASINTTLGHEIGDELIVQLAQRLLSLPHNDERLFRFQSNEFVFLKESNKHEEINAFNEQILQVTSQPFHVHDYEIELFISIGIAIAPFDAKNLEDLRKKSHIALTQTSGKNINTFHYYDESMISTENDKYQLIQELKLAISKDEFELYYQPKIDLKKNQITGAEALIRWNSPTRGIVSPDVFVPIAEDSGLIVDITKWLILQACHDCQFWHEHGLDNLTVAINLSPVDFRRGNLPLIVLKALQVSGLSPHYLELEITESLIIDDVSSIQHQIQQLHSQGVSFAIDDFGTGYSNLGYLTKFNVSTLKIDKSFVSDIHQSAHGLLIVKAIINMSRSLGIHIVAEGVEDIEVADLLKSLKCEYGQGYYWSKPLQNDQFIQFSNSNLAII